MDRACRTRNGCPASQAPALYAISILVVFLCLAALYESWSIPAAVILVVPLGILGAVIAAHLRGLPNDVYFQVGLLTTIGLSAKNAILIVEFAKDMHEHGMGLIEATIAGVPPAPAADPDDVLRLHPGRAAARDQHGGRARAARTPSASA